MTPSNPITHSFHIFGDALCQNYAPGGSQTVNLEICSAKPIPEQRDALFKEFISYIQAIGKEQRLKDSGILPSPEEYIKLRLDSSAIGLVYAITEFSVNRRIPEVLKDMPAMKTIREQTIAIIFLVNDIASFRKELKSDCLHNYIPIAYNAGSSLQNALLGAVKSIEERVEAFEKAAEELVEEAKANGYTENDVLWFIQMCQTYCTGNFEWR
ncbi:terpene synthase family protein [Aspergillus affinis]|uniref:terpene synthase family protein n=1 Tax=Aspergillus affinis TaxID=1070780 RepID=UPI0022FED9F4|nr:terpenoid synthase [Aspergillus affinis]KAI9035329.1 terpenoid synthase [Aspergillus affinis]